MRIHEDLNSMATLNWNPDLSRAVRFFLNQRETCDEFSGDNELKAFDLILQGLFLDTYKSLDFEFVSSPNPSVQDLDLSLLQLNHSHEFGMACVEAGTDSDRNQLFSCLVAAVEDPESKSSGLLKPT